MTEFCRPLLPSPSGFRRCMATLLQSGLVTTRNPIKGLVAVGAWVATRPPHPRQGSSTKGFLYQRPPAAVLQHAVHFTPPTCLSKRGCLRLRRVESPGAGMVPALQPQAETSPIGWLRLLLIARQPRCCGRDCRLQRNPQGVGVGTNSGDLSKLQVQRPFAAADGRVLMCVLCQPSLPE